MEESVENRHCIYCGNITGLSHYAYGMLVDHIRVGSEFSVELTPRQSCGVFFQGPGDLQAPPRQIGWIPKEKNADVHEFLRNAEKLNNGVVLKAVVIQHDKSGDFQKRIYVQVFASAPERKTDRITSNVTQENTMQERSAVSARHEEKTGFFSKAFQTNVEHAKVAGFMEAGRIANNELTKRIAKRLPLVARGYADTPLARIVLANVAAFAASHFRPEDDNLSRLTEAMAVEAYQELIQTFDIEGLLEELLDTPKIQTAMRKASGHKATANKFGGVRASDALPEGSNK
jgi:hypothetical protein